MSKNFISHLFFNFFISTSSLVLASNNNIEENYNQREQSHLHIIHMLGLPAESQLFSSSQNPQMKIENLEIVQHVYNQVNDPNPVNRLQTTLEFYEFLRSLEGKTLVLNHYIPNLTQHWQQAKINAQMDLERINPESPTFMGRHYMPQGNISLEQLQQLRNFVVTARDNPNDKSLLMLAYDLRKTYPNHIHHSVNHLPYMNNGQLPTIEAIRLHYKDITVRQWQHNIVVWKNLLEYYLNKHIDLADFDGE